MGKSGITYTEGAVSLGDTERAAQANPSHLCYSPACLLRDIACPLLGAPSLARRMVTFQPALLKEKIAAKLNRDGDEAWKRPRAHHGVFGHFENPWPSGKESSRPEQFPFESEKELPKSIKRMRSTSR